MMNIKGYDFIIENAEGLNLNLVNATCISEEMCLKLIDKYCPIPINMKLVIFAITEDIGDERK